MKKNLYALFIAVFLLPCLGLSAQTYNAHDLSKLKAFMEQSAGGKRNIDILWAAAPEELSADGSNWVSGLGGIVQWANGRLMEIDGRRRGLSGVIDFENCTGLKNVILLNNNFKSVNLKGCTALVWLYVCVNQIETINIEGCNNVEKISASSNLFTSIDVANKSKLQSLYLPNSRLTSLNVRGCTSLKELTFTKRGSVANLDLSDCPELTKLLCFGNKIESLDLSKNVKLKTLVLADMDGSGSYTNPLKSLNISGCKQLGSYDFIGLFPNLETLNISNCGLRHIDLSKNTKLTKLEAGGQLLAVEKQSVTDSELKLSVLPINGIVVTPSDNGVFANGVITWNNLPSGDGQYTYSFTTALPAGATGTPFSGTVSVPWHNSGTPVANMEVEANAAVVYAENGVLYVRADTPQSIRIFNLMGQVVKQAASVTDASFYLAKGIYIVQSGQNTVKKIVVR